MRKIEIELSKDDLELAISALRAIRLFSRYKTTGALYDYLLEEEICNRADGKLYFHSRTTELMKKTEDKLKDILNSSKKPETLVKGNKC